MGLKKRGKYWNYAFMIDGVRYYGSTKETVLSRAKQFEAMKITEIRQNGARVIRGRAPLLRDLAKRFLGYIDALTLAGELDPDTKRCYHNGWRLLKATDIANSRIDQITTGDARTLIFPGGPSNANQALRTLRRMLHVAAEEFKLMHAAPRINTREEFNRTLLIEAHVEELLLHHAMEPLADVIVIMMDCGMRPEEVMRMRWEDVLEDRGVIFIPWGKTPAARRYVPLSDRMRSRLKARKDSRLDKEKDKPWVFPSPRAKSGHRMSVTKQWDAAVEAGNDEAADKNLPPIPEGLVLYCARHTFATDMLDRGMSVVAVKDLLGHEDIKTTLKYLHPSTSAAADKINQRNRRSKLFLVKESA